jgi:hypothetical protein
VAGEATPINTSLLAQVGDRLGGVDAWFWGHEHNFAVYGPYSGLTRGRLIGHGAIPMFVSQQPYASHVLNDIPALPPRLNQEDGVYRHGFAILKLDDRGPTARVSYYQHDDMNPLIYEETI